MNATRSTNGHDASGATETQDRFRDSGRGPDSIEDLFAPIRTHLNELKGYASFYLAVRLDQWGLKIRKAVAFATLGVLGLMVATAALIVAVSMFLGGLAAGLGELFEGRVWIGQIIVGLIVIILPILGAWLWITRWLKGLRSQLVKKYEHRKRVERNTIASDVDQRAKARF